MDERRLYWPFEAVPLERRTALHRSQIRFLETAYAEGFRPYICGLEYVATSGNGRRGGIYRRGASRWWGEIFRAGPEGGGSGFVEDFDTGADAVLRWLRGEELAGILARIPNHEVPVPLRGKRERIRLHNAACERLIEVIGREGLTCPHCGRNSKEYRLSEREGHKSAVICRGCGWVIEP